MCRAASWAVIVALMKRGTRTHLASKPLAKKVSKLAALRLLSDGMEQAERKRQQRIQDGENPAEVDRAAAQIALTGVVAFFQDQGIESEPLVRLLGDLTALSAGASPSPMLAPSATRHRRPDAPTIEALKGRLAAIMEYRQETGMTRKAAGEWIVRHAPEKLKRGLRLASRPTVDGWLAKWGGQRGAASGDGRDGYLHMRAIVEQQRPTEQQLKKVMEVFARKLPG